MIVDDLIRRPGAWLSVDRGAGVVVSSRVRLARNLRDAVFPCRASSEDRVRVCDRLCRALSGSAHIPHAVQLEMGAVQPVDREVLKERHLISNELAANTEGSAVVLSADERVSVMVNEEDHLRIQVLGPGMSLQRAWKVAEALDIELEQHVHYAFSTRLGYLTACPSNVGTGLRASVMVHLPGLKFLSEADAALNGLNKLGLTVRGLLGEGTEASGNMVQISNRTTLGETEAVIINRLRQVVAELVSHEENARARLMEQNIDLVMDHIGRAYGVLCNARILSSAEAMDHLSALRLGAEFGIARGISAHRISQIMVLTQPGHLQKTSGKVLNPDQRDRIRADLVRKKLRGVEISSL